MDKDGREWTEMDRNGREGFVFLYNISGIYEIHGIQNQFDNNISVNLQLAINLYKKNTNTV